MPLQHKNLLDMTATAEKKPKFNLEPMSAEDIRFRFGLLKVSRKTNGVSNVNVTQVVGKMGGG